VQTWGIRRSIAIGAIVGLALGAVGLVALLVLSTQASAGLVGDPTKIVVVFAIAGEDGAPIAHTVAVVRPGSAEDYYTAETSATVELPGVSASRLSQTYALVGASGVAAALDGGEARRGTAWIDVPPDEWERLMAGGVEVTLSEPFDVFDGQRLIEFPAGQQRVGPADLRALANGVDYLPYGERQAVRRSIAKAAMAALRKLPAPADGVTTNLTPEAWARLVSGG